MTTHRRVHVAELSPTQLDRVKRAFTTRRVPMEAAQTIVFGKVRPRSGDLVLASVSRLGHHRHIEQPDGRRAALHRDDMIVVTYGDRYATDQFESHVPTTIGRTQLVASGGIASRVLSRSQAVRAATDILPAGLLGDERGRPLNVKDFALPTVLPARDRPRTVAVIGTSMNSGKTTTICHLVYGLTAAGLRVGAAKATGTGSGNDYWCMLDAGAHRMLDFTDVGMASTYRQPMAVIERNLAQLVNHLTHSGSAVNLIEIADGIYQGETSRLIQSRAFHELIDAVIFAAPDAMGAAAGVTHLRNLGHDVLAVSGLLTRSPLATREAKTATGLPVLSLDDLDNGDAMNTLLGVGRPPAHAEPDDDFDEDRPVVHLGERSPVQADERPPRITTRSIPHRRMVLLAPAHRATGNE
ncbi:DUF1611 domain-containing protein [Naasia sp. SYSU D00057]|uniref:DUF1611 domain-containing protein n=1 Tax=Naasia sp. SYSU D00057 TaxID=2817380 RepID=UPI001B30D76F|nr:DUF1611 domain-containing protein [Naasia sp. SYSU D00057]